MLFGLKITTTHTIFVNTILMECVAKVFFLQSLFFFSANSIEAREKKKKPTTHITISQVVFIVALIFDGFLICQLVMYRPSKGENKSEFMHNA